MRAFFERWYRPENMAVVVVGDFPQPQGPQDVVDALTSTFTAATSQPRFSQLPAPVPSYAWVPHEQPRWVQLPAPVPSYACWVPHEQPR